MRKASKQTAAPSNKHIPPLDMTTKRYLWSSTIISFNWINFKYYIHSAHDSWSTWLYCSRCYVPAFASYWAVSVLARLLQYGTVCYGMLWSGINENEWRRSDPGALYSMCDGMAWLESTGWGTQNKKLKRNEGDSACSISLRSIQIKSDQIKSRQRSWSNLKAGQGRAGTGMDSRTLRMGGRTNTAKEEEWWQ